MKLYLVRHTDYFNPDNIYPFHLPVYLSRSGREHAKRIGKWFADRKEEGIQIYSSPIVRALQAAEIIASIINSSVVIDERLIETYCPNLQGQKKSISWRYELDDPTRESKESVKKRIMDVYNEKVKNRKDCIFVSHGDPLTILYYTLAGKPLIKYLWSKENDKNVIHKGEIVEVSIDSNLSNASVRRITV